MIKTMIKRIIRVLDNRFEINLYTKARKIRRVWYNSSLLNAVRRNIEPIIIKYLCNRRGNKPIKLHLGCGDGCLEGYVNIDFRKTNATDFVCDIRSLPYDAKSVELIEAYHVIEHLPRHDLPKALKEWERVLAPGGKLIIECPDFDKNVQEYLKGNDPDMQLHYIYGRQRFPGDAHYFGYNFERLRRVLEQCGFTDVKRKGAQDSHTGEAPCFRVECSKKGGMGKKKEKP